MTGTGSEVSSNETTFRMRRRTPGSFLLVPSSRDGRSVRCQGQLEGLAAQIFSVCPSICSITEQPIKIHYQWNPNNPADITLVDSATTKRVRIRPDLKSTTVTPDFLLDRFEGNSLLVEIKPSTRVGQPDVARKRRAAQLYAKVAGIQFLTLTEQDLLCEPLLTNTRLLRRYASFVPCERIVDVIENIVIREGIAMGEVINVASESRSVIWPHVIHMLSNGLLDFDACAKLLTDNSILFPQETYRWDPFESVWARNGLLTAVPTESSGRPAPNR